ncbi:ubiquitin elongating factor core-domain-containing protein [Melanogaster broomeanus]|nr:ubiquitin elongating factor core-domain-containing protein [Melanogaster broomeanus]
MPKQCPRESLLTHKSAQIRAKRLAKLQTMRSSTASPNSSPSSASEPVPPAATPTSQVAKPKSPQTSPVTVQKPQPAMPPLPLKKRSVPVVKLDLQTWEDETLTQIFKVTLNRSLAEQSGYDIVWLKSLQGELASEGHPSPIRLSGDIADRLLISRLELDPDAMSASVLASLPAQMTVFEYLIGCWKRLNSARTYLMKKDVVQNPVNEMQQASTILEKIRDLLISYAGLNLQEPEMFPQPSGRETGSSELVGPLLSLSALSTPLSASSSPNYILSSMEDLARRFEPDNEMDGVLGPVVRQLLFHESLLRPEGLGGGDAAWRGVVGGVEALVSVKSIAAMFTRLDEWNPPHATASTFEKVTLLGPLCRLGVFSREWPSISQTYFSDPSKRTRNDVESSNAGLRGTVKSLQSSLFQIFDTLVRASADSREAVLQYFAAAIKLNVRRAGMQVDPETVASDSFMVNLQSVLLRFAEPFMDARYSKMDRIDPLYFAVSNRIDLKEETRIKATSEEASQWTEENKPNAATPNFISEIFYLCNAMGHYGYLRTIQTYEEFGKHLDELQRHHDMINGDGSWMGTPVQARTEAALNQMKGEMAKIQANQLAFRVQLLEPDFVFRYIGFTNFVSTWLLRRVDPKGLHPTPTVGLPLPQEVPMSFRVLPEYILEDVVDFFLFITRHSPDSLGLSGKDELLTFALTFLTSTWYIKNPFLKAKINEAVHPLALKHLMPALTHFYIEVEQTGASSQFYDKFSERNIAYIMKAIWSNPTHREALNAEAQNVDKFVRFINLMINDVTYLMDESLSELTQIHNIQTEMRDQAAWAARPAQYRRDRENTLRGLERHASGYTTLGKSTVGLLRDFTSETKAPFMMPEIVDKLAAMLDYNLEALVGPKCGELKVAQPEKYSFEPKRLLSDILQVYLNLSDQSEFARATETELEQLRLFVAKVEEAKAAIEAEEDLGEIPDEFLDPLMFTLMRDPVTLPSSRAVVDRSTIKSHLLSDVKDPFNRVPLTIGEVIPNLELKAKIDAFIAERRNMNVTPQEVVDVDVVMD